MAPSPKYPPRQSNIAVLIDGDNAQPALFEKIMLEVSRYGRPTIRRIYGDWTSPQMNTWKKCLHDHAVAPVQQFRNTKGKNATDSALIIDAMDILYSQSVGCFCIVSSDSDYTRLATRIREDGIQFIGIGHEQTPAAFVKACDVFIYTGNLTDDPGLLTAGGESAAAVPEPVAAGPQTPAPKAAGAGPQKPQPKPAAKAKAAKAPASQAKPAGKTNAATGKAKAAKPPAAAKETPAKPAPPAKKPKGMPPIKILKKAFTMSVQEDGWAHLSAMGEKLRQIDPAFDPRTWGYSQLSQLVAAAPDHFTLEKQENPTAGNQYVKLKAS